jgi:hypothetical protein
MTLSINDTQHNNALPCAVCRYAEWHYAESFYAHCCYAECHGTTVVVAAVLTLIAAEKAA